MPAGPVKTIMPALKISLKARALRYLAAREHSRVELARKLARYAGENDDIEALLDNLETAKLLSETRFSESLVNRRAARFGNQRILAELQSHQIDGALLSEVKAGLEQDESIRAREVWAKRFGRMPSSAAERAKQMRFLQQRGFSQKAIQAVFRNAEENEN